MPIETTDDRWREAETATSRRSQILAFLQANPDRAFCAADVASAVYDVELTVEPDDGALQFGVFAQSDGDVAAVESLRAEIETHLAALAADGDVEVRHVPNETLDGVEQPGARTFYNLSPRGDDP